MSNHESKFSSFGIAQGSLFRELPPQITAAYASFAAVDWFSGEFNNAFNFSENSAESFIYHLNRMREPLTPEHDDFVDRIAKNIGDIDTGESVAITQSYGSDSAPVVEAVARGSVYSPRHNRLKSPYLYLPDAYGQSGEALDAAIAKLADGLGATGLKVVVDTFPRSEDHQELLRSVGFRPISVIMGGVKKWTTPEVFTPFVGPTYKVRQFKRG